MDLKLLPLMYTFELLDILFFIRSLKYPTPSFNISNCVTFNNSNTRSSNIKLHHNILSNSICANSYFYRLPRLWNSLPVIDLTLSFNTIKQQLKSYLWEHF